MSESISKNKPVRLARLYISIRRPGHPNQAALDFTLFSLDKRHVSNYGDDPLIHPLPLDRAARLQPPGLQEERKRQPVTGALHKVIDKRTRSEHTRGFSSLLLIVP